MKTTQLKVGSISSDQLEISFELSDSDEIIKSRLIGRGCCSKALQMIAEFRPRLRGKILDLPLPSGTDHVSILFRELILKMQGRWNHPYTHTELCHCRRVNTEVVEMAIRRGADSTNKIARATSAGTGCGSCRPTSEEIIEFLRKSNAG